MPEYFDISLLSERVKNNSSIEDMFQKQFNLHMGKNFLKNSTWEIFNNKEVLISKYEFDECEYVEYTLSFPEQVFHKKAFSREIEPFIKFIGACLNSNKNIKIGLGSYELNGYLLSQIKTLIEITDDFLLNFPIVFIKSNSQFDRKDLNAKLVNNVKLIVNEEAQEIFK